MNDIYRAKFLEGKKPAKILVTIDRKFVEHRACPLLGGWVGEEWRARLSMIGPEQPYSASVGQPHIHNWRAVRAWVTVELDSGILDRASKLNNCSSLHALNVAPFEPNDGSLGNQRFFGEKPGAPPKENAGSLALRGRHGARVPNWRRLCQKRSFKTLGTQRVFNDSKLHYGFIGDLERIAIA